MLIQKKTSKKKNIILTIVAIAFFAATIVLIFWLLAGDSEVEISQLGAQSEFFVPPTRLQTEFSTEILNDQRIKELKQYGPSEVKVQQRGRKDDPFVPF